MLSPQTWSMSRYEGLKAVNSSTFSEFMQYLVFTLRVEKSRKQAGKEPVHDATAAARTYMLLRATAARLPGPAAAVTAVLSHATSATLCGASGNFTVHTFRPLTFTCD